MRVSGSERVGVLADGKGTLLTGGDLQILDGRCYGRDGSGGGALAVQSGATVTMARLAFERNRSVALQVSDPGSTVRLEDDVLRDTASDVSSGSWGRGVHVQNGGRVFLTRAVVERNLDVGIFVGAAAARLEDVRVADTGKRACVAGGTCEDRGGSGAVVLGAGASVMTAGFELARISDQVVYRDNTRKLDSAAMPLPELILPRRQEPVPVIAGGAAMEGSGPVTCVSGWRCEGS